MTPDQRLREIAERENKATKGPWYYQEESDAYTHIVRGPDRFFVVQFGQDTTGKSEANARYMANSRQDVPWLLALIQKQREALEAVVKADEAALRNIKQRTGVDWEGPALACADLCRDALKFSPENL